MQQPLFFERITQLESRDSSILKLPPVIITYTSYYVRTEFRESNIVRENGN